MKKFLILILTTLFVQNILFAQIEFPQLTGRIVDEANILSVDKKEALINILEDNENQTSNQIVVVILKSLKGYDIADYGYQLGRYWKIGQKEKNNGVLLIISMAEKKLRIEVGYGLEGVLTDKISHEIIEYIIKPEFKKAHFYKGIHKGINSIIEATKGEYKAENYNIPTKDNTNWFFLYFAIIFISPILATFSKALKSQKLLKIFRSSMLGGFAGAFSVVLFNSFILSIIIFLIISIIIFITTRKVSFDNYSNSSYSSNSGGFYTGSSRSGGFGGGFSSGGFSGGGGSFGGGGASGGW
ncbi:TPM domain-containing protein [Halarcobacter sp.]|uniref:TPM domain-containing protein n=1 Tax=Halarcobacter sp. TaxID=2321133 RepID=UPI002AA752E0|nr:TPM domain-containing protein [Halarcobacter sp.]